MSINSDISTKQDGNMLVSVGGKIFEHGGRNRKKFFQKNNIKNYVVAGLIHGADIKKISFQDNKKIIWQTDGLITNEKNLFLCLTGADCFPVYFFDKEKEVIGIVHAGWRGVVSGVIENAVLKMQKEFNCKIGGINVILGPGIRSCHFEIKKDIINQFKKYKEFIINKDDKIFVDLPGIIKSQLLKLKLPEKNIKDSNECTYCMADKYFSNRRDKKEILSVMVAYIGMTE